MLNNQSSKYYYFNLGVMVYSDIETFSKDQEIQRMIDVIVWEEQSDDLCKISDFYYYDTLAIDEQFLIGEQLAAYTDLYYKDQPIWEFHFNRGIGRLYFVGSRKTVFDKVNKLY